MRTGLTFKLTGASAGAVCSLRDVKADRFRNWWFRSAWNGSLYTLDAYQSRADALVPQSRIAFGTHAAGEVVCTLANDAGGPFNPTPLAATLSIGGTWSSSLLGWVADPATFVCERIVALLNAYRAPFESLERIKQIELGAIMRPAIGMPAIFVWPKTEATEDETNVEQRAEVEVEIYIYNNVTDEGRAILELTEHAGTVRSILCDEQRKLGGLVLDIKKSGPVSWDIEERGEANYFYRATIPVRAILSDMFAAINSTASPIGSGGKYTAGL